MISQVEAKQDYHLQCIQETKNDKPSRSQARLSLTVFSGNQK